MFTNCLNGRGVISSMRASKIRNGRQDAQLWPTGSERVEPPDFGCSCHLLRYRFTDSSTHSMRTSMTLQEVEQYALAQSYCVSVCVCVRNEVADLIDIFGVSSWILML